jgi:hypothetical protein
MFHNCNPTPEAIQAFRALETAAARMGANNYRAQLASHISAGRKPSSFRFAVTPEHKAVCNAMPTVLGGSMTPNDAMSLLWEHDTMAQRLSA